MRIGDLSRVTGIARDTLQKLDQQHGLNGGGAFPWDDAEAQRWGFFMYPQALGLKASAELRRLYPGLNWGRALEIARGGTRLVRLIEFRGERLPAECIDLLPYDLHIGKFEFDGDVDHPLRSQEFFCCAFSEIELKRHELESANVAFISGQARRALPYEGAFGRHASTLSINLSRVHAELYPRYTKLAPIEDD